MLKMVDGTGIIGVDMICPLGVSTPQPPNYDKVELEGTGILVLPNSLDAPLERLELGGKTEQVTTTGAQLITLANRTDVGDTELGGKKWLTKISEQAYSVWNNYQKATVEFLENNSFKLSHAGGSSANGNGLELPVKIKPNTDYVLSYASTISEVIVYFVQMDSECNKLKETSSKNKQHTFHSEATAEWVILKFTSIANNSYVVNNIQFEKGTIATAYEPYTGGKPSPSPEYPQEIKNSGKWNEGTQKYEVDVKITGKNLFDMNKFIDTCNFTKNEDGTFIIDKHVERYDCFIPANTILSIEVLKVEDSSGAAALELFYEDGKSMYIGFGQVGVKTFLIQKDVVYIKVLAYRKHEYKYIQLEKGNTATPYEPYKEQTLTLTSDRPITKWDRLVEQGGQIGWLYRSEIITLTGDEHYVAYSDFNSFYTSIPALNRNGNTPFCNKYVHKSIVSSNLDKVFSVGDGSYDKVWFRDMRFNLSISDFKSYLQDEYSKGTPVEVVCTTKETEFVPLPQSEQNAIRALKTYYPTTVITVDGGELDPDIKVTYRKEI